MDQRAEEIIGEIRELVEQYRREVPGGRKAWPEAIKSRIRLLGELGLRAAEIARRVELSYYTVLGWLPKECRQGHGRIKLGKVKPAIPHFASIRVKATPRAVSTVTVASQKLVRVESPSPTATVTVTLPNGARIDGVTPGFLNAWLGRQT